MKPDRALRPPGGAAVAGSAQSPGQAAVGEGEDPVPERRAAGARALLERTWLERTWLAKIWAVARVLATMAGLTVLCLGAASLLSLALVRVGFDLWAGIDPFLPAAQRPFLGGAEIAHRAFAVDALRQVLLIALVLAIARRREPRGWRARLALDRARPNGMRPVALLSVLLAWPLLHILWVSGTAELFGARFGQHVRLSPFMSREAVAAWLAYVAVLAPVAEELLIRGELFHRARTVLGPAGSILATGLIFAGAHVSTFGLARPVSLLPLALALGWLRWRTGRLWPGIALHGWSNLALVAYVLWPE